MEWLRDVNGFPYGAVTVAGTACVEVLAAAAAACVVAIMEDIG